ETLAERVAKGPLPIEEALEVCRQIAEGLESAHEEGVIHRDLKPANVKVTPEGKVKILDFGLAKAFEAEPPLTDISQSPPLTEEMTRAGVILGTAAYMSPEQARGKPVDKRADIFAFGAVLYELLTGRRAFQGETITETIASVLKSEPDWEVLPENTPWNIRTLLRRCLQKDPYDRLQHVGDTRIEIKETLTEPTTVSPSGVTSPAQPSRWKIVVPWSVAAVIALAAVTTLWNLTRPQSLPITRFLITPLSTPPLTNSRFNDLAISPDGEHVVYSAYFQGRRQLYVRSMDDLQATPIPGTEGVDRNFFLSPDGQSVAFIIQDKLKKILLRGGAPVTLCDAPVQEGGSWGPGDTIVFSANNDPVAGPSLLRVSASGGLPEVLATPDPAKGELEYQHPEILPGGKAVLFDIRGQNYQTAVLSLDTGEHKVLVEGGRNPHYAPTGHLVYELAETGTLMAVPFDLDRLEITGGAVPILEGVRHAAGEGDADYAFSTNGSLVYVVGGRDVSTVVWVDREGNTEPLLDIPGAYRTPQLSPDGQRLAVANEVDAVDVWTYELDRGVLSRLTFDAARDFEPVWTADGQRVIFSSAQARGAVNLFWKPVDGSGEAEQLANSEYSQTPYSVTPDGAILGFSERALDTGRDIWVLQLDGDSRAEPFLRTPFDESEPAFSPDGHWIAYVSNESGRNEIYVLPFPGSGRKWQISTEGARAPRWAPSGHELFYLNGDQMMVVPVTIGDSFQAGTPRALFSHVHPGGPPPAYSVSPDGKRFVMLQPNEQEEAAQINVVLNWFEELKRLVPTGE
ncbi:MAG: protein kinase, partial [Acidobacteria bacterium]|nr:protein kinase [Acidobacteriota bacterium]